ncbi:unnamed protein product [Vitrella brassicaformis CCMP3155]|uniref:FAST kinase leucine-rich domain-containing protein n=1 Tax=Vitrella brassicaformis (strain CCMP3155) TaxID=1169540 RepID=A0A0G4GGS7_VITBC|nr:unnamed protein product [Vitrella brassicaformis CCMP3155]|eukprot:CEM28850.1 unnamed protein product [Vitrella brassicaformis CCMP3155]
MSTPTEINEMILGAGGVEEILDIVERLSEGFSCVNAATAVFHITNNITVRGEQLLPDRRFKELLGMCVGYLREKGTVDAICLTQFALALARLRIDDSEMTEMIAQEAINRIDDFSSRQCASLMRDMVKLKACPPTLITALQSSFLANINETTLADVTNVFFASADLRNQNASFLEPVTDRLGVLLDEACSQQEKGEGKSIMFFTPVTWSSLARSLSILRGVLSRQRVKGLFHRMEQLAIPNLGDFHRYESSLSLFLFYTSAIYDPESRPRLYIAAKPIITSLAQDGKLEPIQLNQIATSYGHVGRNAVDQPLITMLARAALRRMSDFSADDMARFTASMGRLLSCLKRQKKEVERAAVKPIVQELFTEMAVELKRSPQKLRAASQKNVNTIASAFGRVGVKSGLLLEAVSRR